MYTSQSARLTDQRTASISGGPNLISEGPATLVALLSVSSGASRR